MSKTKIYVRHRFKDERPNVYESILNIARKEKVNLVKYYFGEYEEVLQDDGTQIGIALFFLDDGKDNTIY